MKVIFLLVLLVTGCSSISVLPSKENRQLAPAAVPETLWVRPFTVPRAVDFDVSRASSDPEEEAEARLGRLLAEGILSRSDKLVAPGRLLAAGESPAGGGLMVDGRILRARQGSRALRTAIGFGFGGTKFETSVRVFNLERSSTEPWLRFETTGGSNMEPGLIGALVPSPATIPILVTAAGGAVTAGALGTKGISQDATRTGRTIAEAIHDHLVESGVTVRQARVKRSGRLPTPVGEVPVMIEP
jgi:hypothetical protein